MSAYFPGPDWPPEVNGQRAGIMSSLASKSAAFRRHKFTGSQLGVVFGDFMAFLYETLDSMTTMQATLGRLEVYILALVILLSIAVLLMLAVLLGFGCRRYKANRLPKKQRPIEL